jgi:CRISPR-associated protein Csb1
LAALALCAAALAFENGMGLRSRCLLWPEDVMEWELLAKPGTPPSRYSLSSESALALLGEAIAAAERAGVTWRGDELALKPSPNLLELLRKSQEQAVKEGSAEEP